MVAKLEELLQSLYSYFSSSFKSHLKFSKLAKLVKTKGLEIFRNFNMQWMSMLEPLKCVLVEYKILIIKMSQKNSSIIKTRLNIIFFVMFSHDWPCIACCHIGVYQCLDQVFPRKGYLHFKFCGSCKNLSNWPFYDVY